MGLRHRKQFLDKNCFFVTNVCYRHLHLLNNSETVRIVESSMVFLNQKYSSSILAYVIMPNHFHLILYFNEANHLSEWMRDLKKFTSVKIRQWLETHEGTEGLRPIRIAKPGRVFQVWEDRFDDVFLEDRRLVEIKLDYIHLNPLQEHWCLAKHPEDYPYSSAIFYEQEKQPGISVVHYMEHFG